MKGDLLKLGLCWLIDKFITNFHFIILAFKITQIHRGDHLYFSFWKFNILCSKNFSKFLLGRWTPSVICFFWLVCSLFLEELHNYWLLHLLFNLSCISETFAVVLMFLTTKHPTIVSSIWRTSCLPLIVFSL